MGCINWAWKIQGLKSNEKVALLCLSDRADPESGVCVSPVSRLARACGGWTRQQMNRVLRRLSELGLIIITQRYPGTDDSSRMFTVQTTMIDPVIWRPPTGPRARTIMSTQTFVNLARQAMKSNEDVLAFEQWFVLVPVEVKNHRLRCRVPGPEFSTEIYARYRSLILSLAQEHISATVKDVRFFWVTEPSRRSKKKD